MTESIDSGVAVIVRGLAELIEKKNMSVVSIIGQFENGVFVLRVTDSIGDRYGLGWSSPLEAITDGK